MRVVSAFWSLFLCVAALADSRFCATDRVLAESLKTNPALRERVDALDAAIGSQMRRSRVVSEASGSQSLVIPVVVYIVHSSGLLPGTQENITDAQVQSQLAALNQAFSTQGIVFCLATRDSVTGATLTGSTPGIIRIADSTLTNHQFSQEGALKGLSTLGGNNYLRIWVVKNIDNGSGVVGYARFPGTVPVALEGVVMRYDVFGDTAACAGCPLLPNYDRGKILAHEVGHYLSLYHTFQGGCAGMFASDCATNGDQLCDTPQIASANSGCPFGTITSCDGTSALINNHMDYTNDVCRTAFTADQTLRMQAALTLARSALVAPPNLVATGVACTGGINASFAATDYSPCPNTSVTLTGLTTSGATYAWDFGDGSTGTGNPVTHAYASGGPKTVSLTVTSGSVSVSSAQQLFVAASCAPIAGPQGNWYFGNNAGLNFSSGSPVAVLNNAITSLEASVTQSDAAGNLLFYSDSKFVYGRNHVQLLPLLTGDNSAANGAISVPDPGNPLRYYLIYVTLNGILRTTIVDFSNGSFPNGVLVAPDTTISTGFIAEHVTAIPKCNGADYWVIAHRMPQTFLVYSLTASGISLSSTSPGAIGGNGRGLLKASPDGTMLVQAEQVAASALFGFDRATGAITLRTLLPNGNYGASFSPDSKLLYTAGSLAAPGGAIYQYDVTVSNPAATSVTISTGITATFGFVGLALGPDRKLYASASGNNHLFVINYPNNRNTALDPNACGYSFNGPSLQGRTSAIGLPNMIDAQPPPLVPAIASTSSSCLTVAFQAPTCAASYAWDFGDGSTSSAQNPTHSYFAQGTYAVTLTLNGTSSVTRNMTFGLPQDAATIHGPSTICLSASHTPPPNYSANVHPGLTYQWSVTGGVISGPSASDNVDVAWSTLPGTLQLTVTDPATGCVVTNTITVTENCVAPGCTLPPQPLAAWWTFDETTGTTAHDIAGYVDDAGGYVNGPLPIAGKVGAALEFNGTGAHLEVPDSPDLNFYGGCVVDLAEPVTIDTWVITNVPAGTGPTSGLMTILDKRVPDPNAAASGYSLFLFNGRLGFQMHGINYVAPAAGPDYVDVADNRWHFIAVVSPPCRGPSDSFLYVDGKVVLKFRRSTGFVNNAKLYIGARDPVFGLNYFRGALDELEIFKAVLSPEQLQTIFEAGSHGKCRPDCSQKTIAIAPATLSRLKGGVAYFPAATFTASGGTAPYSFAVAAGALPPRMFLTHNGVMSGTPAAAGTYTFTIATIDANGCRSPRTYQLVVTGRRHAVRH